MARLTAYVRSFAHLPGSMLTSIGITRHCSERLSSFTSVQHRPETIFDAFCRMLVATRRIIAVVEDGQRMPMIRHYVVVGDATDRK